MSNDFWFEKSVFITGINGFIGGNLAKSLIDLGANVFGLIRNKNRYSFLYFENMDKAITLIDGDIIDKELLMRIISEEKIQSVFHLAAQVEIGVGLRNPYLTFESNIKGTYTLVDAIRECSQTIESVIIASSDKAYGSYGRDKMPYKEDYPLIPKYPYDVSKACADMIAQCYATDVYNLPIIVTRFCNIFGPGQLNFSALIPDAIRSALGYTTFIPRSNGQLMRDFIFVEDVANLYLIMGQALAENADNLSGQIFNAGTNDPQIVYEVLKKIYFQIGNEEAFQKIENEMKGKDATGEIDCQFMDHDKVNKFFKWKPKYNFNQGIEKTINWFRKYLEYKYKNKNSLSQALKGLGVFVLCVLFA